MPGSFADDLDLSLDRAAEHEIRKVDGGPLPNRGRGTWAEFLRIHAKALWACDFFTTRAITTRD